MKFGSFPVDAAEGVLLAHSISAGGLRLKKAHILTKADLVALAGAGVAFLTGAKIEADDVLENDAAAQLASSLRVDGVDIRDAATGRVNLHARHAGVFTVDKVVIDAINRVDPGLTIATLSPFAAVRAGQMVATVKIIPFAVPRATLDAARAASSSGQAFAVRRFEPRRVALIQTTLPTIKPSVLDKTVRVTRDRLARSESRIVSEIRVPHDEAKLSATLADLDPLCDLVIIFGASALCDWDDVIPAALRKAGGIVERAGMPVDPGNLLVLGRLGKRIVIGAPGCARSPKDNGFDWVLDRIIAGIDVDADDIAATGVGGLLMEIAVRPQPRETTAPARKVRVKAAILAAGRSSRMGGPNKLLAEFNGVPLIRQIAQAVKRSSVDAAAIVLGHQGDRVKMAVADLGLSILDNPDYAEGLSTSLKTAARNIGEEIDGLLVVLGDMPGVTTAAIDQMIAAFSRTGGTAIVRATHAGKRGNPVLLPRSLFAAIETIEGDTGARHLVEGTELLVIDIELGEAASLDLDTQEAVRKAGGRIVEQA